MAQNFTELSIGQGYANQLFYDLDTDKTIELKTSDWDLIFTTFGLQDAGIHINESSASTFGMPAPSIELYLADTNNYDVITAFDTTFTRLYNDERSWGFGAFNVNLNPQSFFDFGWGNYNPMTRQVIGDELFIIKLRSGVYKKLLIELLDIDVYKIKWANLDGTEEQTAEIDKKDFQNGLALFSFTTGTTLDLDLSGMDLLYTRYITSVPDTNTTNILDYTVTGFLSMPGTEVARIEGMNPDDVVPNDTTQYSTRLDAMGYDWKAFDFTEGWVIPNDLSFLVKTAAGKLYKTVLIDFEGSTTGVTVINKTELNVVSTRNLNTAFEDFRIFPNPIQNDLNVAFSLKESDQNVQLQLFNQLGQLVWAKTVNGITGSNNYNFQLSQTLARGTYYLNIQAGQSQMTQKISIQ
ncbi:MAG: hypothetical protein Sapg2KO_50640 [Saprospiraceae bacterium]